MSASSSTTNRPRVAIIGAGPIGLDMALHARELGLPITIYERGPEVAHNVARWGFVELFSPWRLNVSPLGLETLERAGAEIPDLDAYPTGRAFRELYVVPIARALSDAIRLRTTVLAIGREGLLKGEAIGARERAERT
ncbi:MAG TPA: FAD/NAD(P)-binding oxidoreductase, partial [Planctomycetota bacterium]|nr:FAD/NAD(P)-binding oxidoreductase [Planctomycetota bacterium]